MGVLQESSPLQLGTLLPFRQAHRRSKLRLAGTGDDVAAVEMVL